MGSFRLKSEKTAFVLILILLLAVTDMASVKGPLRGYIHKLANLDGGRFGYDEVTPYLTTIGEPDVSTKLVLGDSVANQLFEGVMYNDPDYCIRPINRAITFAGQYILIKEYLSGHPDATDVYMVVYSGTIASDIDADLAYQYVAMPFIINGFGDDLDETVWNKLKSAYGSFFLKPGVLDYINNSGLNRYLYLNSVSGIDEMRSRIREAVPGKNGNVQDTEASGDAAITSGAVSDITVDYLNKIYDLCSEHGVKVHLLSTPLCDIPERRSECDEIRAVFEETGLNDLYPAYCEGFVYLDESMFMDQVHFAPEYKNRETLNPLIEDMIAVDPEAAGLADILKTD